jgi:hypothetical protein
MSCCSVFRKHHSRATFVHWRNLPGGAGFGLVSTSQRLRHLRFPPNLQHVAGARASLPSSGAPRVEVTSPGGPSPCGPPRSPCLSRQCARGRDPVGPHIPLNQPNLTCPNDVLNSKVAVGRRRVTRWARAQIYALQSPAIGEPSPRLQLSRICPSCLRVATRTDECDRAP